MKNCECASYNKCLVCNESGVCSGEIVAKKQQCIADISENQDHVTYSDSDDGEENYYRDVFVDGFQSYSDGEVCTVEDTKEDSIVLSNDNACDDGLHYFEISKEQFEKDFRII